MCKLETCMAILHLLICISLHVSMHSFPAGIDKTAKSMQNCAKIVRMPKGPSFSVALPAEPRGEKKLFFVQILGGEKLLKFGEKWAVKNF